MHQRISIGFSCAALVVATAQGCIQSSCEEKRTCGGSPPPSESEAGSGGSLGLLPRTTGGRANFASAGAGGSESETATGGATSEAGSGGEAPDAALGGGGSGGEPASAAGGEPATSEPDACTPSPCAHGTCSPLGASFECECDAGYSGDLCEKNIDDCTPNPCQNGGRCDDGVAEYACVCDGRFTGENCELPRFEIIEPEFEIDWASTEDISADGRTIGGYYVLPGGEREGAFLWEDGAFEVLPIPPGYTKARGYVLSADGTTLFGDASYYLEQEGYFRSHPVVWRDGKAQILPLVGDSYAGNIYATTVDGSIAVGTSSVTGGRVATIWSAGAATVLELDSLESYASGVSADGKLVVGKLSRDGKSFAFLWRDGTLTVLPNPTGVDSCWASGVTADGTRMLGACVHAERPEQVNFLWTNGVISDIQPPSEQLLESPAFELGVFSSSGDAAAGFARVYATGEALPVVWTAEHGMRWLAPILETQGVDLSSYNWAAAAKPRGISDDGKIVVGTINDNDNVLRGFIARLP